MSLTTARTDIASSDHLVELVRRVNALVLTVAEGAVIPRTSPVFFAFDEQTKTAYWLSSKDSTHSKNIATNSHASVAFVSSESDGQSPSFTTNNGMNAKAELVATLEERAFAYELLQKKARTLPETLEDLEESDALRTLYKASVINTELDCINVGDSQYMVLGTAPEGWPQVLTSKFIVKSERRIQLTSKLSTLSSGHYKTHACIFDGNVKQGDGVGVYFNAAVVTEKSSTMLDVETNHDGVPLLTTNGLFEYKDRTGWIDAQVGTSNAILQRSVK